MAISLSNGVERILFAAGDERRRPIFDEREDEYMRIVERHGAEVMAELAEAGYHDQHTPPVVLCNECQAGARDPFVIERIDGVYVTLQHPRPLPPRTSRRGQLTFAIP